MCVASGPGKFTWEVGNYAHLSRIMPNMSSIFQPLEDIIRTVFIPTISGRLAPNDTDRDVFALPTTLGGLGLATQQNSVTCSSPLLCSLQRNL